MTEAFVRRAGPDDWGAYREVRLAALADSPRAFGSTVAIATALSEAEWRRRLAEGCGFLAVAGDRCIGLIGGFSEAPGGAELVSMWVQPDWRGRGVGDQLVAAVVGWAANSAATELRLWVAEGNDPAERLYARNGFTRSGEVQPVLPETPDRLEFRMVRRIDS